MNVLFQEQIAKLSARIQLITAMNPCRCGMSSRDENVCIRGPRCAIEYQSRISGPLMDRIDIRIAVPAVPAADLFFSTKSEPSEIIDYRVLLARKKQKDRLERIGSLLTNNAVCSPALI